MVTIVHQPLVFMLAGVLAFEIGTVGLTMKRDEILCVGLHSTVAIARWRDVLKSKIWISQTNAQ